jgi:hypothetical protein
MTKLTLGTLVVAFLAANVLGLDCNSLSSILLTAAFAAAAYCLGSLLGRKE